MTRPDDATKCCEDILISLKQANTNGGIRPSESVIIDRLLSRRVEMTSAYKELAKNLTSTAMNVFLGTLVNTTAYWGLEKSKTLRQAQKDIASLNRDIATQSEKLARLLVQRARQESLWGLSSGAHCHVVQVIEEAGGPIGKFNTYIKAELHRLSVQYDESYWPSLGDIAKTLSGDSGRAKVSATDQITDALTSNQRASKADFFKTLFAAIEQCSTERVGFIPSGYRPTDSTLATVANCALDLADSEILTSTFVKRLRQSEHESRADL